MRHVILLLLAGFSLNCMAETMVIGVGGTYTFAVWNDDPSAYAVDVQTTDLVIFKSCLITTKGGGVRAHQGGANIWMENCVTQGWDGTSTSYGLSVYQPGFLGVLNNSFARLGAGVYVLDGRSESWAQITIRNNRFDNTLAVGPAVQFNQIHANPKASIQWNQIIGCLSDGINIYLSSGRVGQPILVANNYVEDVAPLNTEDQPIFIGGIVTDGITSNPEIATAFVEISRNQVVGCPGTGITLAHGLHQKAHHNRVINSGITPNGTRYKGSWAGMTVQGDKQYQPLEWLRDMQVYDNHVGSNRYLGGIERREDFRMWNPDMSNPYIRANTSPHDGEIRLEEEQAEFFLWKQKCVASGQFIGPKQGN